MRSLRRPKRENFDVPPDNPGLTMPVPPQPSRLSSEAPEVVPGQFLDISTRSPTPNASVSSPTGPSQPSLSPSGSQLSHFKGRRSPTQSWLSSFSDRGSRKGRRELIPTPQIIYEEAEPYQPKTHTRRVFGLVTTIVLVLLAFCLGGGIGGGVATAVLKTHHKSDTPAASTVVVDMAGCPLVANTTYTSSTGASFLIICATSILPQTGQFIDLSHSVQPTFDSCLDACGAADGCVGATWYMFDSTTPARNSGCYLKNGTGQEVVASSTLSVVSAYRTTVLSS